MIVHQVTEEDISIEQDVTVDDLIKENVDDLCFLCLITYASEKEMEAYEESVIVANSTKDNVAYIEGLFVSTQMDLEENILQAETHFIPSMCTHQLSAIEIPIENCEYKVSMAVHRSYKCTEEDNEIDPGVETDPGMIYSMVSHQIDMEDKSKENLGKEELTGNNLESSEPIDYESMDINQQIPLYSMVAHQLHCLETPTDFSDFLVSTASHGCLPRIDHENDISDSGLMTSMVVHHQIIEPDNLEILKTDDNFEDIEEVCVSTQVVAEENILQTETWFIPSMWTHQLSPVETLIENSSYQVSMAVHRCDTCLVDEDEIMVNSSFETDPRLICSMVSHQVGMEENSKENFVTEELTENNLECMDVNNLQFMASMISHQLPSSETQIEFSEFL